MPTQADHFDRIAPNYDATIPPHVREHYLRKRVRLIGPLLQGRTGLDVGCGTGTVLAALRPYGKVTGVDGSAGMLEVLRREGRGEAVQASCDALPFADGSFDVVFCVAVLHHLAEPAKVAATLREMLRVARKPGGRVVVWDHNPANPYWRSLMRRAPQDTGDERLIPPREIVQALKSAGARSVRILQSGFVPEFVPSVLMPLARAVEWIVERTPALRLLCAHNVVIAET